MAKDIAHDESAKKELVENYHRLSTPTIVIGKRVFMGFRENRAEIEKMLSLHSQQIE